MSDASPPLAASAEDVQVRGRLPRPLLAHFDRVRERHQGQGLALIRVTQKGGGPRVYHCSACNYMVRPQVVVEIRSNGSLVQCDSCKRILYLAPQEAQ